MKFEKPKFPNPTIIKEDFLPSEYKYRIKKVSKGSLILYYPQKRVLIFWLTLGGFPCNQYMTLEHAKSIITKDFLESKKKSVEYILYEPHE